MKHNRILLSLMLLLITINSFGEPDHDDFGETHAFSFSAIAIVLLFAVMVISGFLIYTYFKKKEKKNTEELNELAFKVSLEHNVKEEIIKNQLDTVYDNKERQDNEIFKTAKLWLSEGVIDIDEYDKICDILEERRKNN